MRGPFLHRYTWHQYVTLEQSSNVKHEFLDGEIFAMSGGTPEHAQLAVKVSTELSSQLQGKPCRVFSSDLRVRVQQTGLGTYPDVTVVCGELQRDPDDKNTVTNPTLIVEVLSDSTESWDRGEKFEQLRRIPTLKEYVLVSQREKLLEVFRVAADGNWFRTEGRTRATVRLESVSCDLDVDRIYADVELSRG